MRPLGAVDWPTGILFARQSVAAIRDAVELFECNRRIIIPAACHQNASRFSVERFDREILKAFDAAAAPHRSNQVWV